MPGHVSIPSMAHKINIFALKEFTFYGEDLYKITKYSGRGGEIHPSNSVSLLNAEKKTFLKNG